MILRRFMKHVTDQNWLVVGLVAFIFSFASFAAEDHSTDKKQIKLAREASNQAIAAHDVERLSSFFDVDYIINYGSSQKSLSLKEEIKSWEVYFQDYPKVIYTRTPVTVDVSSSALLAMEHGTWEGGKESSATFSGKYTAGWRKTDGVWKIHVELFVTLMCRGSSCE
jgi:ketosteroid isomerase-like protein